MSQNSLGDTTIGFICKAFTPHFSLKKLNLAYCKITARGAYNLFHSVTKFKPLEELVIDGNEIDGRRCKCLKDMLVHNRTLTLLSMNHCKLGPDGAVFVGQGL